MYYRYNRYDSDDPDIDEEFIDESRTHKVTIHILRKGGGLENGNFGLFSLRETCLGITHKLCPLIFDNF